MVAGKVVYDRSGPPRPYRAYRAGYIRETCNQLFGKRQSGGLNSRCFLKCYYFIYKYACVVALQTYLWYNISITVCTKSHQYFDKN